MSTARRAEFLKEAREVIGMFFLHRQDSLPQTSGRGIVIAKVVNHIVVAIDGDTLSNQILFKACR